MRKTKSKVIKSLLAIVTKGSLVTGLVAGLIASANTQRHFVSQSGSSTVTQLSAESDLNKSSSPAKNDGQSIDKFLDNKDGTLLLKVGQQEAFKA